MEWIDTHCHMDHKQLKPDRKAVMQAASQAGVGALIVPAISLESNFTMRGEVYADCPETFFAVGIHPNHTACLDERTCLGALEKLIDSRTVAIGETGLDFFRTREPEKQALQRFWFERQIELALKYDLPLILHVRDAWDEALKILRSSHTTFSGVAHCFAGTWDQAQAFLELGFGLGIGGAVTRENPGLLETAAKAPLCQLVLETDAPFLAPRGCKGRNSPENLPLIGGILANIRKIPVEEVSRVTSENARRIFHLPGK